jgi:hypothetical protein
VPYSEITSLVHDMQRSGGLCNEVELSLARKSAFGPGPTDGVPCWCPVVNGSSRDYLLVFPVEFS